MSTSSGLSGGHPEPSKLSDTQDKNVLEREAATEFFESIVAEVVDEVGVPRCDLTDPLLMGIDRNRVTWGRPTAQFFMKTNLCAEEVKAVYKEVR